MRAAPKHLFSSAFEVRENGRIVCVIDQRFWRERATFRVGGRIHSLGRDSGWGDFWVREGGDRGSVLGRATKASVFRRRFDVVIGGESFVLAPRSLFGFSYELRDGEQVVGSIRRAGFFSREMAVDLPDDLPVAVRVFLLWLVLLMIRRARSSSE